MKGIMIILFLLIFLPLLGTMILSGKEAVKISKQRDPETLLAMLVYQEIPPESEEEMIRAQAVLVRSRIWREIKEGELQEVYDRVMCDNLEFERTYQMEEEKLSRCRQAVTDTAGCVLSYGGQIVEGPFCRASNGWTRSGGEVLGKEGYGWIVAVQSKADLDYRADRKAYTCTTEEIQELMEMTEEEKTKGLAINVVEKDSSGYVTDIEVGEVRMSGESFRQLLGLPSASFTFEMNEKTWSFVCRGEGHGMGLSQNGANALARSGKDYREILDHYFPNAQVENY